MNRDLELEQDVPAWEAPLAARSILQVFWQRKAFVLLGALVGLALGFLYHTQRIAVFQSSCQILVIKKRAGDALPVSPLRDEQADKRVAKRPDSGGEIFIERLFVNAQCGLMSEKRIQFCRACGRSAYCQPQRTPMNWKAFDVS